MSLNWSLLDQQKPWLNARFNALTCDNRIVDSRSAVAINTSGNLTAANVFSGLITSTTAAGVTLTLPAGFAAALVALMQPINATQAQNVLMCQVCNSGANAISFASSDSNAVLNDSSMTVAAHTSRQVLFVITNASTPVVTVY